MLHASLYFKNFNHSQITQSSMSYLPVCVSDGQRDRSRGWRLKVLGCWRTVQRNRISSGHGLNRRPPKHFHLWPAAVHLHHCRDKTNAPFGKVRRKWLFGNFQVWLIPNYLLLYTIHVSQQYSTFVFLSTNKASLPKNRFYSTRQNLIFSQEQKENNDVCQIRLSVTPFVINLLFAVAKGN